jgi:hypothetical protein
MMAVHRHHHQRITTRKRRERLHPNRSGDEVADGRSSPNFFGPNFSFRNPTFDLKK